MTDFLEPIKSGFGALDAFKEGGKAIQSIAYIVDKEREPSYIRRNAEATSQAIEQVTNAIITSSERLRETGMSKKAIENFQTAIIYRQTKNLLEILEFIPEQEQHLLAEHPEQDSTFDPDNTNGTEFEDFFWRVVSASTFTGDTELQKLWAAVLVRGCYFSGSVSPKTLDVLRTMTRSDAELFSRYCSTLWKITSASFKSNTMNTDPSIDYIVKHSQFVAFIIENVAELKEFELQRGEEADLISLGLVPDQFSSSTDRIRLTLEQFDKQLSFIPGNSLNFLHSPKGALTRAGEELYPIAAKFNPEYFNAFEDFLRKQGWLIQ